MTRKRILYKSRNLAIDNEGNIVLRSKWMYLLDEKWRIIDTTALPKYRSIQTVRNGNRRNSAVKGLSSAWDAVLSNPSGLLRCEILCPDPELGDAKLRIAARRSRYIRAGSLELSNVDLANEFTEMITTQRGFQANSRIITTSDSMLEELVNLKR
jgi:flagellar hook protein FlgE